MATITSLYPGPAASGTFSKIEGGRAIFTSTTVTSGSALTTTAPWAGWVDASTATTVNVPLNCIATVS